MVKKIKSQPNKAPATASLATLTKRQVRYWCFRFKTEALDGVPAVDAPAGLRAYFEALEWFSGWKDFALSWDVKESEPLAIKPLKEDPELAWDRVLLEEARELPVAKKNDSN